MAPRTVRLEPEHLAHGLRERHASAAIARHRRSSATNLEEELGEGHRWLPQATAELVRGCRVSSPETEKCDPHEQQDLAAKHAPDAPGRELDREKRNQYRQGDPQRRRRLLALPDAVEEHRTDGCGNDRPVIHLRCPLYITEA